MKKEETKGPTRITKLRAYNNVLCGRDLSNLFKEGHVYEVYEILGQIILKDLGEHAEMDQYIGSRLSRIIMDGRYCLTKAEYEVNP